MLLKISSSGVESARFLISYYNSTNTKLSVDVSSFANASRVLSDTERRYPQLEKEGLAIIYGIEKLYDYLYVRKFTLLTDHKPLYHIFGDKKGIPMYAANRLQRWAIVLSSFDFEIVFV